MRGQVKIDAARLIDVPARLHMRLFMSLTNAASALQTRLEKKKTSQSQVRIWQRYLFY